jgi:beta-glucosidase
MRRRSFLHGGASLAALALAGPSAAQAPRPRPSARVARLLASMTPEEKAGQLNQIPGGRSRALNSRLDAAEMERIRRGGVGSYLHVAGAEVLRNLQRVAVEESRLRIPLLFAMDVVHGYRTIYPVSLGMAASWDPANAEACARMAATEASVAGLHWTFAPMVDIARDARWGRVVEGAGEDPHLGAAMAAAQVRGYQGDGLSGRDVLLATAKHFGAYGVGMGGRDYDSAEISERTLNEVNLVPFYAAVKAGAGAVMTAFNDIGGVPTTANPALVRRVLRDRWGFEGLVVSDWDAVAELMNHGIAATRAEAAALALRAGVDMDMTSGAFAEALPALARADRSLAALLDSAVTHVLTIKERLGLFDDPYRFGDPAREREIMVSPAHRARAREAAHKAIVLLKNENRLLPLPVDMAGPIALIGALADDSMSQLGSWRAQGRPEDVKTLRATLAEQAGSIPLLYEPGASPTSDDMSAIAAAVRAAERAQYVILALGESFSQSGEARSRSDIGLPGAQAALAEAVLATGKPTILVLMSGRPLALPARIAAAPAILMTWLLGVEAGPAIVDVLFGEVSPGGKLPIGFPRTTGQSPLPYAHYPSGRPADPDPARDSTRYFDTALGPLFPFGHGLSYASFAYSDFAVSRTEIAAGGTTDVSVLVRNTGARAADEIVQLYIRDPLAPVARPVKELRGFKRLTLAPAEAKRVTFRLAAAQTAFWDAGDEATQRWRIEAGRIDVMVGSSSEDIRARGAFTITSSGRAAAPAAALMTEAIVAPA